MPRRQISKRAVPKRRQNQRVYRYCKKAEKRLFPTELDAKIELAGHLSIETGNQRIYKCLFGNHYHLTSEDQKTEPVK